MRMWTGALLGLATVCLICLTLPLCADESSDAFNTLFGEDLKRVNASGDTSDDVALAARMLAAAKSNSSQAELVRLLCEHACTLGTKASAGYGTAVEAMEFLISKMPEKKAEYQPKLLAASLLQYEVARAPERSRLAEGLVELLMDMSEGRESTGEYPAALPLAEKAQKIAGDNKMSVREIQDQIKELTDKIRASRTIAAMKSRLTANPQDMSARTQLILSYLVDLDNPAEAGKYLDPSNDAATLTYVPLAAKELKDMEDFNCLALGEWYQGLPARTSSTGAKINMLNHAKACFDAYLEKHAAEDVNRAKAKLLLDKVEEQLAKLTPPEDASTWPDLLRLVDLSKHGIAGKWDLSGGKLSVVSEKHSRMMFPVTVDGSYRMQVKFTRTASSGGLVLVLPAGTSMCELVLGGFGGDTSGLALIRDVAADKNDSNVKTPKIVNKQEYTVDIDVAIRDKNASISVELNGKKYIRWQGNQSLLSLEDAWKIFRAPKALGVGVMDASVTISSARLKVISGSAQLLDDKTDAPKIPHWNPGPSWGGGRGGWGGGRKH